MCGIGGFYDIEADEKLLDKMKGLVRRQEKGLVDIFVDKKVGLYSMHGDADNSLRFMQDADKRFAICLEGKIFNRADLGKELISLGHKITINSDTEVVLAAYIEWGKQCFDRFNGAWALAIYDKKLDVLVLSRDHLGIKAIYYAQVGTGLLFASKLTPIVDSGRIEKKPNDRTIYRYLNFRVHDDGRETFFDGVQRLLPGEMLVVKAGETLKVGSYTNLAKNLKKAAKKELPYDDGATEKYRGYLERSIRLRLDSDSPLGTSLSGGLDSSSVAVIVSKLMEIEKQATLAVGPKQNLFSAVFPGSINDEEKYVDAALAACKSGVNAHKIKPNADEFKLDLEDFLNTQEEPTISTGPYAQYKVMEAASQQVKVILDGQGADETMAGYLPYYFVYLRQLKRTNKIRFLGEAIRSSDVLLKYARIQLKAKFRKKVNMSSLLATDFMTDYKSESFINIQDNLKLRLLDDLYKNSIPSLLRYEDRNTARFGIEGRVPFLDKDLLEYVFSLEDAAIIKNGWNKRILRDSLDGVLPDLIRRRRNKIGFTTPEHEWFMHLKNYFYGIFMSEEFKGRKYFKQGSVVTAFEEFIAGKNTAGSMTFWRLAAVELWMRRYFDQAKPEPKIKSSDFEPNGKKKLDIELGNGDIYRRYPLRTDAVTAKTKLVKFIKERVNRTLGEKEIRDKELGTWYVFISEKIVAITQGRSYFLWDIKARPSARLLSRFVKKTPYGIGLGSPFTMELAIREVGLLRILLASVAGVLGKLVGKKGLFYIVAGGDVRAIDGPTEYSVYPANVSAKLAPKNPNDVARRLDREIRKDLRVRHAKNFAGVVIIDANDLGRNILGKSFEADNAKLEAIFADNPLGQGHEQTPLALVVKQ